MRIQAYTVQIEPHAILALLGDPTRLRLLNLLLQSHEELCVCEMVDALKVPQYVVSKHLSALRNAGLLHARREGTWVHYRLNADAPPLFHDLCDFLRESLAQHYEQDACQLARRLALRDAGRCVVGGISDNRTKNCLQLEVSDKVCCSSEARPANKGKTK
ncbi:MAG: ArsR/SmtB family transcription factor [Phycisphaerales bacterium]